MYNLHKKIQKYPIIDEDFFCSYDNDYTIINRVWTDLGMKEDSDIYYVRDYYCEMYRKEVESVNSEAEYIELIYDIFQEYVQCEEKEEEFNEDNVVVYTDGATVGHNGRLGTVREVGLGIYIETTGDKISKRAKGISNNEAEFMALIEAMKVCLNRGYRTCTFISDSTIVVNRATNRKKVGSGRKKNKRMDDFQIQVLDLAQQFDEVEFIWVKRERNTVADKLSKQATYD